MSNRNPDSYIITQVSNSLENANSMVPISSNQTANVYASYGVPDSSNKGNMTLIGHGTPSTETKLDLRLQRSGTIENAATYIWKDNSELSTDWRGDNDSRFMYDFDAPYCTSGAVPQQDCFGATACFADFLKTEFIYYVKNQTTLSCAYRVITGVNDEDADWTIRDVSLSCILSRSVSANIDVSVTIKNTLVMAVVADNDIQIFQSTDGFTWTLVCHDVLKRFSGIEEYTTFNIRGLKFSTSGDYARIVFGVKSQEFLYCLSSSDLGLSWKRNNIEAIESYVVPQQSEYSFSFDLCPVQDSDGSFMLSVPFASEQTINSAETRTYIGFVTQDFNELSENRIVFQNEFIDITQTWAKGFRVVAGKVFLFKTDSHIYLVDTGKVPYNYPNEPYHNNNQPIVATNIARSEMKFSYEIRLWRMPLDGIITSGRWQSLNDEIENAQGPHNPYQDITNQVGITGFCNGSGRFWFGRSKFYFLGNSVACFTTQVDTINKGAAAGRHAYFKMSGWSKSAINDTFPTGYSLSVLPSWAGQNQPKGKLFDLQWQAMWGLPNSSMYGLPNTCWTEIKSGTNSFAFMKQDHVLLRTGSSGQILYQCVITECDDPSTPAWGGGRLIVGGSFVRAIVGKVDTTNAFQTRFRIGNSATGVAGGIGISVWITRTQIWFEDTRGGGAKTVVITPDTGIYGATPFYTYFWEIRLVFEADPKYAPITSRARILARKIGSEEWITSSLLTYDYSSGSVNTNGSTTISFGQIRDASHTDIDSAWKCLEFRKGSSLGMLDDAGKAITSSYTELRGRPCNTVGTTLLKNYLQASFGGGSGAYGDTYTLNTKFSYSINNAVGSPLLNWRSDDDSTDSYIIFKASKASFLHNGWGIFGLNCKTVKVEYSDDLTFTTGVNTIATKDLSTGIIGEITAVYDDNSTIDVTIADYKSFQDFKSNGLVSTDKYNLYTRFTTLSGTTTALNVDDSMRIIDNFDDKFVLDIGSTPIYSGAVGTTVTIYSGRISFKESSATNTVKKYCKVTMSGDTSEGYHTLGSFVAGQVIDFTVPMDWNFTDTENSNLQDNRSRSGVRWSYPEGPPTRTISGRIVGDVTQYQRSKMRTALRKSQYSTSSICLVITDEGLTNPNNVVLTRYVNEFVMDNAGWYYDSTSQSWYTVGDTSITFEEEV
jgi:hypothetical protein